MMGHRDLFLFTDKDRSQWWAWPVPLSLSGKGSVAGARPGNCQLVGDRGTHASLVTDEFRDMVLGDMS